MSAGLPATTTRRVNVPLAESFQMLPFPKSEMYAVRPTKASPSSCRQTQRANHLGERTCGTDSSHLGTTDG